MNRNTYNALKAGDKVEAPHGLIDWETGEEIEAEPFYTVAKVERTRDGRAVKYIELDCTPVIRVDAGEIDGIRKIA